MNCGITPPHPPPIPPKKKICKLFKPLFRQFSSIYCFFVNPPENRIFQWTPIILKFFILKSFYIVFHLFILKVFILRWWIWLLKIDMYLLQDEGKAFRVVKVFCSRLNMTSSDRASILPARTKYRFKKHRFSLLRSR